MKILVIGSGGREHAIIKALSQSSRVNKLYATPGNGGISELAECFDVKATDIDGVTALAKRLCVDFVFVAPDDPLVLGMVDKLNENGIKTFGPRANAAILEGSKVFSKALMKKYNIPTAKYEHFTDYDKAVEYIISEGKFPVVIKADGLALGKGVIIAMNIDEAKLAVNSMLNDRMFGESSKEIVVEEFLTGPEVTVLAFADGESVVPMISSMDHKRAFDNDEGLNTGGMGTIAPNPCYTTNIAKKAMEEIFIPTINAMKAEGRPFSGCLYFGLMLTSDGPKVIEYNARFGDPEAQVVLPLLDTDLVDIMEAIWDKKLNEATIRWKDGACACVVIASGGYPQKYEIGKLITGLEDVACSGEAFVYHAGTRLENGKVYTNGGRVLGVTSYANSLTEAIKMAYKSAEKIGVSRQAVSKWERSEASPDTDNLIMLARTYGVSLDELLYTDEIPFVEGEKAKEESNDNNDDKTDEVDSENEAEYEFKRPKSHGVIHVDNGDEYVNIGAHGVYVEDKSGARVKVGWDGVHVYDPNEGDNVHVSRKGVKINGEHYDSDEWSAKSAFMDNIPNVKSAMETFPFAIIAIAAFLTVGFTLNAWDWCWMIILTIPIYHGVISSFSKKNASLFPIPIIIVVGYLFLGFGYNAWWWAWIMFLIIPLYYGFVEAIKKRNANAFPFPVLLALIFIWGGLIYDLWHPLWIIFMLIPVYYWITNSVIKK